jgi:hypothetical protein
MNKDRFHTNAASFDGWNLTYYCYNEKHISVKELIFI